jgi:hypothetical protein
MQEARPRADATHGRQQKGLVTTRGDEETHFARLEVAKRCTHERGQEDFWGVGGDLATRPHELNLRKRRTETAEDSGANEPPRDDRTGQPDFEGVTVGELEDCLLKGAPGRRNGDPGKRSDRSPGSSSVLMPLGSGDGGAERGVCWNGIGLD